VGGVDNSLIHTHQLRVDCIIRIAAVPRTHTHTHTHTERERERERERTVSVLECFSQSQTHAATSTIGHYWTMTSRRRTMHSLMTTQEVAYMYYVTVVPWWVRRNGTLWSPGEGLDWKSRQRRKKISWVCFVKVSAKFHDSTIQLSNRLPVFRILNLAGSLGGGSTSSR